MGPFTPLCRTMFETFPQINHPVVTIVGNILVFEVSVKVKKIEDPVLFFYQEEQIFHVSGGCRVSAGPCPSLMDKRISCDGSVRKGPNLQPRRHDSYTAFNGFG